LRSDRLIFPWFFASSTFCACSGVTIRVATVAGLGAPLLSTCCFPASSDRPMESTRTFSRIVEVIASAIDPGRVNSTSTREPGCTRPATALVSEIGTDTARWPRSITAATPSTAPGPVSLAAVRASPAPTG
jgi:hypothetical protein